MPNRMFCFVQTSLICPSAHAEGHIVVKLWSSSLIPETFASLFIQCAISHFHCTHLLIGWQVQWVFKSIPMYSATAFTVLDYFVLLYTKMWTIVTADFCCIPHQEMIHLIKALATEPASALEVGKHFNPFGKHIDCLHLMLVKWNTSVNYQRVHQVIYTFLKYKFNDF